MTDNPLILLVLLVLLALSASFSASETAFFSLEGSERDRASDRVRRLLNEPQDLLITILLANLIVNLLFFVFAHRLGNAVQHRRRQCERNRNRELSARVHQCNAL